MRGDERERAVRLDGKVDVGQDLQAAGSVACGLLRWWRRGVPGHPQRRAGGVCVCQGSSIGYRMVPS